jgi:K+-sensing histidine kinase KdpD
MILETFERWRRGRNWGYGFAIIAFIVAFAVRYGLEDLLPPGLPFLTFFPAVILTSFFAGVGPAVLVTALSVLAAWYFFLPQLQSFNIESDSVIALVLYVFINALIILLVHTLNVAIERLREERGKARALADQSEAMFAELQHRISNNLQIVVAQFGPGARHRSGRDEGPV